MVYSNKLVAVITVNNRPLREFRDGDGDKVYLPFGTEYGLRFKNKDVRRVVLTSVEIDGEDVLRGNRLVIDANCEGDLLGFMETNGDFAKNRFRFIEKTAQISEFRGDRLDDGLVRIEYQFEKPYIPPYVPPYRPVTPWPRPWRRPGDWPSPWEPYWHYDGPVFSKGSGMSGNSSPDISCNSAPHNAAFQSFSPASPDTSKSVLRAAGMASRNEDGITVAGSIVNQSFGSTTVRELDVEKHVIVLYLKGKNPEGEEVQKPKETRAKETCSTCGHKNPSSNRFCGNCTTCLV